MSSNFAKQFKKLRERSSAGGEVRQSMDARKKASTRWLVRADASDGSSSDEEGGQVHEGSRDGQQRPGEVRDPLCDRPDLPVVVGPKGQEPQEEVLQGREGVRSRSAFLEPIDFGSESDTQGELGRGLRPILGRPGLETDDQVGGGKPIRPSKRPRQPRRPRPPRGIDDEAMGPSRPRSKSRGPAASGDGGGEKDPRHQYWFFTWNNYTDSARVILGKLSGLEYMVYQPEIGANGTKHLQGWFAFRDGSKRSFQEVKKSLGQSIHLEELKGGFEEAEKYCTKEETRDPNAGFEVYRWGTIPTTDRRAKRGSGVLLLANAALKGASNAVLARQDPVSYMRNHTGLSALRMSQWVPRSPTDPFVVEWYYGNTGSGKSYRPAMDFPNAYWKMSSNKWWDGYEWGDVVVWDEFRDHSLPYASLLTLLDHYPLKVEIKGGSLNFNSPRIIFTSPFHPEDVYPDLQENVQQLLRRISRILYFDKWESYEGAEEKMRGAAWRKQSVEKRNEFKQPHYLFKN